MTFLRQVQRLRLFDCGTSRISIDDHRDVVEWGRLIDCDDAKPLQHDPISPSVPKYEFRRDAGPDGAAFEMFRAASLPHFAISLRDPADAETFYVQATTYQTPHVVLTRVRGGPMIMRRGPAEIAQDPNPPLLNMHIQLAGESDGTVDDRDHRVRPGDILFYDYARALTCTNTAFECITLLMSRDRAHPAFLHPQAHGAVLPGGGGPARLVAAIADVTHGKLDQLTMSEADHALQSLIDLAGRMLENHLALSQARADRASPIKLALSIVDEMLDDTELTSTMLAQRLGMSRSALYRVFEPLGGVENAIRRRRLDRAMRTILTGHNGDKRAVTTGFKSEEHFARAFQARFGARPSRYREMVVANNQDWLMEQARRMGFQTMEAWIKDLAGKP